jgi:hypothetical protein
MVRRLPASSSCTWRSTASTSPVRSVTWRLRASRAIAAIAGVAGTRRVLPSLTPRALATARATRVRWLISPASSSATAAICVIRNLLTGPAGTVGRSQNTTPASPLPSTTESRKRALRASRSSFGDQQHGAAGAAGGEGCGELGPVGALAALHLLKLRHQLAAGVDEVGGHCLALRLQAKAGASLAVRGDAQVADEAERGKNHPRAWGGCSTTLSNNYRQNRRAA